MEMDGFFKMLCGLSVAMGACQIWGQVRFVEVAELAGIDFRYTHGGTGQKYFIETMGPGCAFLDYDGDGFLDLYAVNGYDLSEASVREETDRLYRNDGDGTFTDVTHEAGVGDRGYGVGVCAADYDNDGDADIYLTNYGPNTLYKNNGDGTFADVTAAAGVGDDSWGTGCAFLDYDNDGALDLYAANYVEYSLDMPGEDFTPYMIASQPGEKLKSDVKSYPHPDNFKGAPDVFYRNNGDGTFADVTVSAGVFNPDGKGMGMVCGDYDNDGDMDIFVANDQTPNFLYQNNGDRTFTDMALLAGVGYTGEGRLQASMGADFGDYDNDGFLDLVVSNFQHEPTSLYRNEGDGLFSYESLRSGIGSRTLPYVGWGIAFFDCDNDGLLDLFIANGHVLDNAELFDATASYPQRNQLFRNTGQGKFAELSDSSGEGLSLSKVSRGAAFGDYDNDGDVDIFVVNSIGRADLLRNDGGNEHNWLQVRTLGVMSNRDGIGARVEISAAGLHQIREIKAGSGLYSQSDLRACFGLGKRKEIDILEVRWPSGTVDRVSHVAANQRISIEEGVGLIDTAGNLAAPDQRDE